MGKFVLGAALALTLGAGTAFAAEAQKPAAQAWSFNGVFGTYDRAALRRGLQVYTELCAACHSLRLVYYRHLQSVGFSEEEVKALAAEFEVEDGPNDEGEMFTRPAKPTDPFVSPFPNTQAARAANAGALPPDLSVMTKARKGGENYLHAVLTGYRDEAPAGVEVMEGLFFNDYFPGQQIAMPPPLADDAVEYADGTKATVEQMSTDVVTFLAWAAEPTLEDRKRLGIKTLLFLLVLTAMLYALKRKVWADVH
jgi:ubiquinol-cytochrome c reductase cytochrome c1 subunit